MKSFIEVCLYEVKPTKVDEFIELITEVAENHKSLNGVIEVKYMHRTHRQEDFNSVKLGKPAIRLSRKPQKEIFTLFWECSDEMVHAQVTKAGLEKYYKRFQKCLTTMPKIILGDKKI